MQRIRTGIPVSNFITTKTTMNNEPSFIKKGINLSDQSHTKTYVGKCKCGRGLVYTMNSKKTCSGCSKPDISLKNN